MKGIKKYVWLLFMPINLCALEIRSPLKHEIEAVAELYYSVWHDTFDTLSPQFLVKQRTKENCLTQWQEYYHKNDPYFILIALEKRKIVGVLFAGPMEDNPYTKYLQYEAEINKLYVDPKLQNQGIGSKLLKAGLIRLRVLGFKNAVVCSLATNANSNTFYEKKGGTLIGHSDDGAMNIYGFSLLDQQLA